MKQVFIFWASSTYWVWSTFGWRAWLLKNKLHEIIYSQDGVWEDFEVFNFWKTGVTIDFLKDNYLRNLEAYKRKDKTMILVNIGGNDLKARDEPTNYVSSPEDYKENLKSLLSDMKKYVDKVVFVASWFFNESKTTPKKSPFGNHSSYFFNDRKKLFDNINKEICQELDIGYLGIDIDPDEWASKYTYTDWLHANNDWYRYSFEKIWTKVKTFFEIKE